MRIFMTRAFAKFARKERISEISLIEAVLSAEIRPDADLGGGIIKQRVARPNQGKSGGYRTVIFYRQGDVAYFVYGFAKNAEANVAAHQMQTLRALAPTFLLATEIEIQVLLETGKIKEIGKDAQE